MTPDSLVAAVTDAARASASGSPKFLLALVISRLC